MDVIELWDLLTATEEWTFETFPWNMFLLCHAPAEVEVPLNGYVTTKLFPDDLGRFGFKVKGGREKNLPVLISRVIPNSPADMCCPRLKEGDEILRINGQCVADLTHEQVVDLIHSIAANKVSRELILTIYPNVCIDDVPKTVDFEFSDDMQSNESLKPHSEGLVESMLKLKEQLENGVTVRQFEKVHRRKSGMTMNIAKLPENIQKNRYRDIFPYDSTRVILKGGNKGNFINASHVNIKIPVHGIVNKYIATQGPLPHTCADFWQMIWEQYSKLIVMVTTLRERGRTKCHKYWPDPYQSVEFGKFQITNLQETENSYSVHRHFLVVNVENLEERHIIHLQYMTWPDHGVPDEPKDFLHFVEHMRKSRRKSKDPVIVHCSAGVGRTGVLILMETAMCHIEANQLIHPLDILCHMREQRPMLIQTSSQYKFVCEAMLQAYNGGLVKPVSQNKR